MNNGEYAFITAYCKKYWSDNVKKTIKIADDVCDNTFVFEMPWDMERTDEPTHFDGDIDWYLKKNGDNEYLFQMNRMRYVISLAQAYRLTGDEKYVRCFISIMSDWITTVKCPRTSGDHPWRSLEVGIRGEYWTKAMRILKGVPLIDDSFESMYKGSLLEHADMLMRCHDGHKMLLNWGVIQDHGLFDIGIELNNKEFIDTALDRLYTEAKLQIMRQGMHWEVSSMYHNEVLSCFIDVILRARENSIPLKKDFLALVHKMAKVNLNWMKPNKKQPLFGDSDYTDIRDILSLSSFVFGDPQLKSGAFERLDYESVWLVGEEGVKAYESMPVAPSGDISGIEIDGTCIMRENRGEKSNYLIFHNGYTGGGHAHEDKLSFELTVKGKDMLVDTGRYTYVWGKYCRYLKSYRAHNTISIDSRHFIKTYGWGFSKLAPSIKQGVIKDASFELAAGTHLGYASAVCGVVVTRKILWIKPDIYVIIDVFNGHGIHRYTENFNFAPNTTVRIATGNSLFFTSDKVKAYMRTLSRSKRYVRRSDVYSDHYNNKESIDTVNSSFYAFGRTHAVTVIVADTEKYRKFSVESLPIKVVGAKRDIPRRDAECIKIVLNGVTYHVMLTFRELMRALDCDGKYSAASIAYYKDDEYHVVEW